MSKLAEQINTEERKTYFIKDMGRVVTGKTPSKDNPKDWGSEIDFITPTDFSSDEKYLSNIKRKISQGGAMRYKNMILPPESVVVTCIGSDMGKVIVSKKIALTNQQINSIVVNKDLFDLEFVYYVLKSLYSTLRSIAEEGGSTMPIITKSVFEQIEFDAPDLPTQKKIAGILSAYDAKIENNNKIIKNLETTTQAIFNEWFVNFRFPGYEKAKFVESEMGEIPEGWEVGKLTDISKITMGQSPASTYYNSKKEGLPFHQGVTSFGDRYPEDIIYSTGGQKMAEKGDILVSVRAPVGRINIANSKTILGRGLSAVRSINNQQSFLLYLLKNLFHKEDLFGGGSVFPSITKSEFEKLKIVLPSSEAKTLFDKKVRVVDLEIKTLFEENVKLKESRDQLLTKLI